MFDGFKKVVEGVSEILEPINPLTTNMDDKNKKIASDLIQLGYSVKEIQNFVDVSRSQLDDFIEVEKQVYDRLNPKKEEPTEEVKQEAAAS